jgi:hypothetical protein
MVLFVGQKLRNAIFVRRKLLFEEDKRDDKQK